MQHKVSKGKKLANIKGKDVQDEKSVDRQGEAL